MPEEERKMSICNWHLVCIGMLLLFGVLGINGQIRVQCPRLQRPWNGNFLGTCERYLGAECVFECRRPYVLVGSRVRRCRADGTWSGETSACELNGCADCEDNAICSPLYDPDGGYTEGQCNPGIRGQTCIFRCTRGYVLVGQAMISCQTNGQWNGAQPQCRRTNAAICEALGVVNGHSDCATQGDLVVCHVTCNEGFMLVGSSVLTCSSSGQWREQLPSCRPLQVTNICPTLVPPEGGRLVGSCTAANTGDTCQLVCISGYRPSDTRVLICQSDGRWSDTLPECLGNECPAINLPTATTSGTCSPGRRGQSCTITCRPGFVLTGGTSTLICQENGQWSGPVPSCREISCPALPSPASGGTSGSCRPGVVGQTCNFFCNAGFRLVGERNLVCGNNGRWSSNPPFCTRVTCPPLPTPMNGAQSGSCNQPTVGQVCSFSCQAGFVLNGPSNLVCQEGGSWSNRVPTCSRVSCPALPTPQNGAQSGSCTQANVGQTCSFNCQAGFVLNGPSILICQEGGSWSSRPPICSRVTCPPLPTPQNGAQSGSCNQATVGQTCSFSCQAGFNLDGPQIVICQAGGRWSSPPPACRRISCPGLSPPPNGGYTGSCTQASIGESCTFICQAGFVLTGQPTLVCQPNGAWSSSPPSCTRVVVTCPNLNPPENGYMLGTCAPGQVGQTCVFGCDNDLELDGERTLTCQPSGRWSGDPPTCKGGGDDGEATSCPILTPPPNGEFVECDNRPGGRCVVVCQKGYLRVGSRVRTCLAQGTWSGFAPTCSQRVGYTTYTYKVVPLWKVIFG